MELSLPKNPMGLVTSLRHHRQMMDSKFMWRGFIMLLLPFSLMGQVWADSASQLQRTLNKIRSMRADFQQTVSRHGQVVQTLSGTFTLYRPGRFRWDITRPTRQIIVADGMKLWQYEVNLKQVTVRRLSQLQGGAALLLSSSIHNLGSRFNVTRVGNRYQLTARQSAKNDQQIEITVQGLNLQNITIRDALDNVSQLTFSKVQVNIPVPKHLFSFTPPKGVDVLS